MATNRSVDKECKNKRQSKMFSSVSRVWYLCGLAVILKDTYWSLVLALPVSSVVCILCNGILP